MDLSRKRDSFFEPAPSCGVRKKTTRNNSLEKLGDSVWEPDDNICAKALNQDLKIRRQAILIAGQSAATYRIL
jgi:hypothetical protein